MHLKNALYLQSPKDSQGLCPEKVPHSLTPSLPSCALAEETIQARVSRSFSVALPRAEYISQRAFMSVPAGVPRGGSLFSEGAERDRWAGSSMNSFF